MCLMNLYAGGLSVSGQFMLNALALWFLDEVYIKINGKMVYL